MPSAAYRTPRHFRQEVEKSERKPCAVPGCKGWRHRIGRYCRKHDTNQQVRGSVYMNKIYPLKSMTKSERVLVGKFLKRHASHPAILAATSFLEYWLEGDGSDTSTQRCITRLRSRVVQPISILTELAIVWTWQKTHEFLLHDSEALTFALGRAVLSLAPAERVPSFRSKTGTKRQTITGGNRREVGQVLRLALHPVLHNIATAILSAQMQDPDQRKAIRTTFTEEEAKTTTSKPRSGWKHTEAAKRRMSDGWRARRIAKRAAANAAKARAAAVTTTTENAT